MSETGQKFSSGKAYVENSTDFKELLQLSCKKEDIRDKQKGLETNENNALNKIEDNSDTLTQEEYEQNLELLNRRNDDLIEIKNKLEEHGYIATDTILYTIKNAMLLNMPILIEGEPGVGKTSLAEALAKGYDLELIRIQFYEGISNNDILYEYDYAKQMLYMNAIRDNINNDLNGLSANEALTSLTKNGINFFDKNFLIERPLLKAISGNKKKVLLLDEIDKTSEETEYLLLEILSNYAITIPEYGTVKCNPENIPIVFLTSNNYRDLSDALKRRCLYLYIEPKTIDESKEIIAKKANVSEMFALSVAEKVNKIRKLSLKQKPSISDSINWALTLTKGMGINSFDDNDTIVQSLGTILKNKSDIDLVKRSGIL